MIKMSSDKVNREFREFGDRMYYILIFFILNFILPVIAGIVMLVFTFKALGNIKRANKELKSDNLDSFRSSLINSFILLFIAGLIVGIAAIFALIAFWPYVITQILPDIPTLLNLLLIPGIILIAGLIILLIAGILQMQSWGKLNAFFTKNTKMFPEAIAHDAIKGAEKLKTASLLMVLGFLIITVIIGFIYEIIGYSKLAKLRNLPYSGAPTPSQPVQTPSAKTEDAVNLCPYCGAKKGEDAEFCSSCGQHF